MVIYLIASIVLLLCGILAASSLIVASKPNAAEMIAKIAPYQGGLGIATLVFGIIMLIEILPHMGALPVMWLIILLAEAAVQIGLGILLGYGLIAARGGGAGLNELRAKLQMYQIPLGLAGIVLGILGIVRAL